MWLLHDVTLLILLGIVALHFHYLPVYLRYIAWPVYWVSAGIVGTGVWVIAHECGHSGFSSNVRVNNVVGYILHTSLLVPYYSWKFSHAKHHKATAHLSRDQVFVPKIKNEIHGEQVTAQETVHSKEVPPLVSLYEVIRMLFLGWPAYLLYNASGQKYPVLTSHFKPGSPIYESSQWAKIVVSDVGVFMMLCGLAKLASIYGAMTITSFI
jgi:omega-6 fatty acid desaturase (delta-12 desaturase)